MELPQEFKAQVVDVLRALVRIDTTNPPGNEIACARYLAELLAPAGVELEIIESAPGRGNLIARLRGTGEEKPLLLLGHMDVVAADPAEWRYPPFAAEIHDGCIWGRGTTDMKQMIAVSAVIILALARLGRPLRRDVILAATADEEHGGRWGVGWLVKERPELFAVACALNEGGGGPLRVGERVYYTCQCAEKGVCRTVWTAQAKGGHGSQPRHDLATFRLARAIAQLGDGHLQGRAVATMELALRIIAAGQSPQAAERVEALLEQGRIADALGAAGLDDEAIAHNRPLFYDTAAVTALRAGDPASINVIPPTALAYVDGRILPGQTREGFLELLRRRAGEGVTIEVYEGQYSPGLESSPEAPIYRTIGRVIVERGGGAEVIPWMCSGSTDARYLIPRGVPVFGFVPSKPHPEDGEPDGAHANDERIRIEDLLFALDILYDVVYRFCSGDEQT